MSDLNINVLVAAKDEYTKQLVYLLSPEIYKVIHNIFLESQNMKKKRSISLKNFQILLKKVPEWNDVMIDRNISDIKSKIPFILDLITAIFVSHVKILGCVKLTKNKKSIKVKVPNINFFLHKIIIEISEHIYYNPDLILKKKDIVIQVISSIIENSLRNQIPIDKILTEYLSGVFDKNKLEDSESDGGSDHESDLESEPEPDDKSDNSDVEFNDDDKEIKEQKIKEENSDEDDEEDEEEIDINDFKSITTTRPIPNTLINPESTNNNPESTNNNPESTNSPESTNNIDIIPTNSNPVNKKKILFNDI